MNYFETRSRNKRGEDHVKNLKHYPLHKILQELVRLKFRVYRKEEVSATVNTWISACSQPLMEYLEKAKKIPESIPRDASADGLQKKTIENIFETFSNQLISHYLYGLEKQSP